MVLPAPDLDDRRFQDFVDDAKRLVQRRCPEWTDHNVHDPGVTLIEAFAMMADQLVYRLNRVPDRLHLRFLELVGVRLYPPAAARVPGDVLAVGGAARADRACPPARRSPAGVRPSSEPVCFTTAQPRHRSRRCRCWSCGRCSPTAPCASTARTARRAGGCKLFGDAAAGRGRAARRPRPGRPRRARSAVRLDCRIDGIGVDPTQPAAALGGLDRRTAGRRATVDRDTTGGFNQPGEVVVHLPAGHATSLVGGLRAGWLRARDRRAAGARHVVLAARPTLSSVRRRGGRRHRGRGARRAGARRGARRVRGRAGAAVRAAPRAGAASAPGRCELEVSDGRRLADLADRRTTSPRAAADDAHAVVDPASGEVELGPVVRLADGTVRQHGAVPPAGAVLRVGPYLTGGGARGNVGSRRAARAALVDPVRRAGREPLPGPRRPGRRDPRRGPRPRRRSRCAAAAARSRPRTSSTSRATRRPRLARVRCVPAEDGRPGDVRLLVVPALGDVRAGAVRRAAAGRGRPATGSPQSVDARRLVGTRVVVEPPVYQGVTVVARLRGNGSRSADDVRDDALAALHRFLSPVVGGPDGDRLAVRPGAALRRGVRGAAPGARRRAGRGRPAVPGRPGDR